MNSVRPSDANTARAEYAALTERVAGLSDDVNGLRKDLQLIVQRLDERSKTQWPTLLMGASVVLALSVAIGALASRPIDAAMDRHEKMLMMLEARYVDDLKQQIDRLRK